MYSKVATKGWAELAKKWYTYELGPDSEQTGEMEDVIAHPERHRVWRMRDHEIVGLPDFT